MAARLPRTAASLCALLLVTLTLPLAHAAGPPAAPPPPEDVPIPVVSEPLDDWTLSDGLLYWSYSSLTSAGYLRRMPAGGGTTRTLAVLPAGHRISDLAADAGGLYYHDIVQGGIYARPVGSPYDPPFRIVDAWNSTRAMVLDGDLIYRAYWEPVLRPLAQGTEDVVRFHKDGSGYEIVASGVYANDLAAVGSEAYWVDETGLWRTVMDCGTLPCSRVQLDTLDGVDLLYHTPPDPWVFQIYTADRGDPYGAIPASIRMSYGCQWIVQPYPNPPVYSCGTEGAVYTATLDWSIGVLATNGTYLYWTEKNSTAGDGRVRRMLLPDGPVEDIAADMGDLDGERLYTDDRYVYFARTGTVSPGIYRLPLDAGAIFQDLAADALEVTQGIQNLANDVDMVDGKPTYVRGYGRSDGGPAARAAEASLYGTRDGSPLPGSPLAGLNGTIDLEGGVPYDRWELDQSWLFRLPDSWTAAGTISLMLVVDARGVYNDPNPTNNTLSRSVDFFATPPSCHVYVPVRTDTPVYSTPFDNPHFGAMLDLSVRMWPIRDIWVYADSSPVEELQTCWKWGWLPYPCYGPYEMEDDSGSVLTSLVMRWLFSDDPDRCDAAGAETHYIGMVHPADYVGDAGGAARTGFTVAWLQFAPDTPVYPDWRNWPEAGVGLAHETAHNMGRLHVDCGDPDYVDPGYPYPVCQIDDAGRANHFGFDSRTWAVISPTEAADLLSYGPYQWTSDYTWNGILMKLWTIVGPAQAAGPPDLSAAAEAVLVSGAVTPSLGTAALDYAWVYPTSLLSGGIRHKWQSLAGVPAGRAATTYHVQLLDAAAAVLADVAVTPTLTIDVPGEAAYAFAATLPAPGGAVAEVRLLDGASLLASRSPGMSAPAVTLVRPAGGESYGDELLVQWQAADPDGADTLHYTVQYSPDDGQSWRAVLTDFPGPPGGGNVAAMLDASTLPGSAGANGRIRVAASDGYHTGLATSAPFSLADHPPTPYIASPADGEVVPVGRPLRLRGGAADAEDGPLSDVALVWTLGGQEVGTGPELLLAGMAPGSYTATLAAQDSAGHGAAAQVAFEIAPLAVPFGDDPALDGFCDDPAYAAAVQVQLAPYPEGGQATVQLLRSSGALWACFSGLDRGAADPGAAASLRVDVDYSGDDLVQPGDGLFVAFEDGGYTTRAGDGAGGWVEPGPGGLQAQVSAGTTTWSAELRLDAAVLGGWGHWSGLALGHIQRDAPGDHYWWPYQTVRNAPSSWAQTALGLLPKVTAVAPVSTTAGSAALELAVFGANLVDGSTVRWDGADLPTTFVSSSRLSATLSAAQLAAAGTFAVTAAGPGGSMASSAVPFVVWNPVPAITALSPARAAQGGPGFALLVSGSGFVDGAAVLWDGRPCVTTYLGGTLLRAWVEPVYLDEARTVAVTVHNPAPSPQGSAAAALVVEPRLRVWLPMVVR